MLSISIALLLGQAAVLAVPSSIFAGFIVFVVAGVTGGFWVVRWRREVIAFSLGVLIAGFTVHQQQLHKWPTSMAKTDVLLTGTIDGIPRRTGTALSFFVRDITTTVDPIPRRIRLNWYQAQQIPRADERWQFYVRLKPPSGLGNPGGFDAIRHSFVTGLDATGYVRQADQARLISLAPRSSLDRIRQTLAEKLLELSNGEAVSLVLGLALGMSDRVSDQHWQLLRETGTVHLLAISGLHIGLVAAFSYGLAAWLWAKISFLQRVCARQVFAVPIGFLFALIYAALAGFSLPTKRALIMLAVVGLGLLLRRASIGTHALSLALVVIVIMDPAAILSIGFVMSFSAVAILIYLSRGRMSSNRHGVLNRPRALWGIQWRLSLFMLPLSAWFFGGGSLISPLANLVAVPLVGVLLVPLCMFTVLIVSLSPVVASKTLYLSETLLGALIEGLQALSTLPGSHVSIPISAPSIMLLLAISVVLLLAPKGVRLRRWSLVLMLPVVQYWYQLPVVKQLELHVLDVGQGLSAVVFTPNHTLLFDTGGRLGESTMMERVVVPFLRSRRRSNIDTVVISHSDEDHSAGLDTILASDAAPSIFVSENPPAGGQACRAGESWRWDNVWFAFVHPAEGDQGSRNDRSCVLLIHYADTRFLLTGDIEHSAEQLLLARGFDLPVTLMTAPHHGSATSSSTEFLNTVQPQHVVVPVGQRNRYGLPAATVLQRYAAMGSRLWLTSKQGAISFIVDRSGELEPVKSYWQGVDRLWR